MSPSMIQLRNIYKSLGGRPVLRDVTLEVRRGESLVIVGSSGTGKSVTLQHMVGLLHPDAGDVLIEGECINRATGRAVERIREKFGVLFQSGALINWMNVFDNVALPLYEKTSLGDEEIAARVREALALVDLQGTEARMPAELSGGMRKRAGLARAIIMRPLIVLYDEPTSGLDPVMSRRIDRLIRDVQRRFNTTAVVVTHDLQSAFTVGDRIAMLAEGRIVEVGTPAEFRASTCPAVQEFISAQFSEAARAEEAVAWTSPPRETQAPAGSDRTGSDQEDRK
ncbi:MAG: ABC transporter ATP-binding protein [Kiritimatiellaeota bacterium]|nr:ABC transporter ATP-binding protein [Kiritimatiellota bacterium]